MIAFGEVQIRVGWRTFFSRRKQVIIVTDITNRFFGKGEWPIHNSWSIQK